MTTSSNNLKKWFEIARGLEETADYVYTSQGTTTAPERSQVFRVLELLAPEDVRVVVLGQDPYHVQGKASGIAFGYAATYTGLLDSSLANILEEVGTTDLRANRTLESWVRQGVLLLNTRLTVELGRPMSHAGLGWEGQVQSLLTSLNKLHGEQLVHLVFGAEARRMTGSILPLNSPNVIVTSHPCRFSNLAGPSPFTGSKCFERANEHLIACGLNPINWKGE